MTIQPQSWEQTNEIMGVAISKLAKSLIGFYDPDQTTEVFIDSLGFLESTKSDKNMKFVLAPKTDKTPASLSQVWFDSEIETEIKLMTLILDEENPAIETVKIAIDETQAVMCYRIDSEGGIHKTHSLKFGSDEYTQSAREALKKQDIIVEEVLERAEKVDFAQTWNKFSQHVAILNISTPKIAGIV